MDLGKLGSMRDLGVTESYKLKRQVVISASEGAEMILRSVYSLCISQSVLIDISGWTRSCARPRGNGSASRPDLFGVPSTVDKLIESRSSQKKKLIRSTISTTQSTPALFDE